MPNLLRNNYQKSAPRLQKGGFLPFLNKRRLKPSNPAYLAETGIMKLSHTI